MVEVWILGAVTLAGLVGFGLGGMEAKRRFADREQQVTTLVRRLRSGDLQIRFMEDPGPAGGPVAGELAALAGTMQMERELRTQLTRDIVHEFRTPLAVLRSQVEAIQDGVWAPTVARMELFAQEIDRLIGLVEDLDHLADAELKMLTLKRTTIPLRDFLDGLADGFEPMFARKRLEFRYDPPPGDLVVVADRDKVGRIVINLLSNAYKYTPEDGAVGLAAWQEDGEIHIAVADTGSGIHTAESGRIFDRSYRTQSNREMAGKGLGLTIARTLAEAHGGRILLWTESGLGSVFTLVLPAK